MMKKITLFIGVLSLLINVQEVESQNSDYLKSNVAISRVDLINKSSSVLYYELELTDFSGTQPLPKGFGLNGFTFTDDGKYNDRVPNDGIYSSKETISSSQAPAKRSSKDIYYDETSFVHKLALKTGKGMKGVGCEFEPCGCPCGEFTCLACEWWGWSCWKITKCEFIIDVKM